MDDEILQQFQTVFNLHDAAIDGLRRANTAMGQAIQAHDAAAVAALEANRAAIQVLRLIQDGGKR